MQLKVLNSEKNELIGIFDHQAKISKILSNPSSSLVATISIDNHPTRSKVKIWDVINLQTIKEALATLTHTQISVINKLGLPNDFSDEHSSFQQLSDQEIDIFESLPKILKNSYPSFL